MQPDKSKVTKNVCEIRLKPALEKQQHVVFAKESHGRLYQRSLTNQSVSCKSS